MATAQGDADRGLQAPSRAPLRWASFSPDNKTVLFARNHNLYMMDAENYAKAQKNADDTTIVEIQLTTDGEEYYSYSQPQRRARQPGQTSSNSSSSNRKTSSSRSSARTPTTRTRACRRWRCSLVARLEQVLARPPRRAQGQGPLGHQRAGQPAPDARDLPLRDARRGEHAAVGDLRLRRRRRRRASR